MKKTVSLDSRYGESEITLVPVDEFCQRCGYFTSVWKADDEWAYEGYASRFCTKCEWCWNAGDAFPVSKGDEHRTKIMEVLLGKSDTVPEVQSAS